MPVGRFEMGNIRLIAGELDKLAQTLREYPTGSEDGIEVMGIAKSVRSAAPSGTILASLQKINGTLAAGAGRASLSPIDFTALGQGFEEIAAALKAVGSASKK